VKTLRKSRSSTSFKRLKKVGTSQVVSSPEHSTYLEEDASKQGRNEAMGSGEANVVNNDAAGLDTELDTGKVSGEVLKDAVMSGGMEIESPQDMDGFVVTDKQGNKAVVEELVCVQENVVEKLKTLGPEQL
jgi:hypothetical protein